MNSAKRRVAAIVGATGMVGRRFAELLVDHPWFEIGMIVGHKSTGRPYGEAWDRKEKAVQDYYGTSLWTARPCPPSLGRVPVRSIDELLAAPSFDLIFSAVPPGFGEIEQEILNRGYTVFSNSPHGRFEEENPLVVAEVNGDEIRGQRFIKNPNCVTSGLSIVLAALRERYGLTEVSVVTFQSLSGKGDSTYPLELVLGNVYPLHGSTEHTEENITREIRRILRERVPISVSCNRVYVQEGHFVDLKLKTVKRIGGAAEVTELLRNYSPLEGVPLPSRPSRPIVIIEQPGRPRPRQDAQHAQGMAVAVGSLSTSDDVYDLRLQFVVNNLVRGAAGGAILNAELHLHRGALT
jgi:aspartate-semialdehyde dehydrogenase